MDVKKLESELLGYIVSNGFKPGDRLPSLERVSEELGISVGKLREQLEVARHLGLVEVKPRTGIRCEPYDFLPAVRSSLLCAIAFNQSHFYSFSELRNHIEASYWYEAVPLLEDLDKARLSQLMESAWAKLNGNPIHIPHAEHRALHLTIFSRLQNAFVKGILEAYWEGYEAVELNLFADYQYLQEVWSYHQKIVDGILSGNYALGHAALIEHTGLLRHREPPAHEPLPSPAASILSE